MFKSPVYSTLTGSQLSIDNSKNMQHLGESEVGRLEGEKKSGSEASKKGASVGGLNCKICNASGFQSKRELAGHKAGKHRQHKCSTCGEVFENGGKLGNHKIEVHGYTRKQLGWDVAAGWNRAKADASQPCQIVAPEEDPEFINKLNSPEYQEIKMTARRYHEEVVAWKEKKLRELGYRTFNTSNYTRHNRIPDIIAISSGGKILAIELESVRRYKSSIDSLRKKYVSLLGEERFFDDVMVEGFGPESES
jgi:hypothetical protein